MGAVRAQPRPVHVVPAALAALTLVAAGCSGDKPKPAASTSSSTTTTTTTTAAPRPATVTGKGLPADLLATMKTVYLGGTVPVTASMGTTMTKRRTGKGSVALAGGLGTWKGTPVAAVTYGKDVTLLAKDKSWKVVGGWWPSLGLPNRVPSRTSRILVIGSDARPNQTVASSRADSLHIVGFDAKGIGGIVGIPRDSWVPIATGGTDKINAALVFGGAGGLVRTVEHTTGVQVDGYVMTGFAGFRAMINRMGGLKFVATSILRNDQGKTLLKEGLNILGGEGTLSVARERHTLPNGDFGRSANQGRIMLAGMTMAKGQGPAFLPKYLTAMSPNVFSDLTPEQVLNLCATIFWTNPNAVPNKVAPGGVGTRGGGQSVVLLGSGASSLFADIKDGRLGG